MKVLNKSFPSLQALWGWQGVSCVCSEWVVSLPAKALTYLVLSGTTHSLIKCSLALLGRADLWFRLRSAWFQSANFWPLLEPYRTFPGAWESFRLTILKHGAPPGPRLVWRFAFFHAVGGGLLCPPTSSLPPWGMEHLENQIHKGLAARDARGVKGQKAWFWCESRVEGHIYALNFC